MTALATPGFATQQEAYDALIRQGATPEVARILAAVTRPESSGFTAASNGTYLGLWQIGNYHGFNNTRLLSDDIDYQAASALAIYREQGFGAWETYTNGSYLKYLNGQSSAALPPQDMSNFSDIPTWQQHQQQLDAQAARQRSALPGGTILDSPGNNPNGAPNVLDSPTGETASGNANVLNSPNAFGTQTPPTPAQDPLVQAATAAGAAVAAGATNG